MGDFIAYQNSAKQVIPVSPDNPLPVTIISGGGGGGGGGGGAVTVADGADVALGATTDVAASSDAGTFGLVALTKRLLNKTTSGIAITAASLPLPTGAATAANQATANASLASTVTALTGGQKGQATSVSVIQASDPDVRPGSQTLSVVDSASTTTAGNNSVNYMTGTPTAGSVFVQAVNGVASATVSISAITGTLNFEVSGDGSLWVAATARQRGASYTASSTTGTGVFEIDLAGKQQFRCRLTAGTSATFTPSFTTNGSGVQVMNPVKLYDNTSNAQATIKPASTASVATDTAMVVTPRPGDLHTVISYQGSITATVVTLSAASSGQLIASNTSRKGLRWQNIGSNPMTVAPGASAAVVGQGMQYGPAAATGYPGDGESFEGNAVPTNAFQAISTLGTTVVIWEQT